MGRIGKESEMADGRGKLVVLVIVLLGWAATPAWSDDNVWPNGSVLAPAGVGPQDWARLEPLWQPSQAMPGAGCAAARQRGPSAAGMAARRCRQRTAVPNGQRASPNPHAARATHDATGSAADATTTGPADVATGNAATDAAGNAADGTMAHPADAAAGNATHGPAGRGWQRLSPPRPSRRGESEHDGRCRYRPPSEQGDVRWSTATWSSYRCEKRTAQSAWMTTGSRWRP